MHQRLLSRASLVLALSCAGAIGCARSPRSSADTRASERARAIDALADATAVLGDIAHSGVVPAPEGERARCVVVFPALVRGGLVLGATHGHGVATCRTAGPWSGPVFVTLSGGSAGLQVGLESSDLVMLVMTERSMAQLFRSSFQLGVDSSVAAGPTGQGAQAGTDVKMTAEILSYARTRGLFAGVQVTGAVMRQERVATAALYGDDFDAHAILTGRRPAPVEAAAFLAQVGATFPRYADDARPIALGPAAGKR